MNFFSSIEEFSKSNNHNTIVTIGSFDGVHTGHRMILKKVKDLAIEKKLFSVVLTFNPHPRDVIRKQRSNNYLMSQEDKNNMILNCGIDAIIIHPFTNEFSNIDAKQFLHQILLSQLKMEHLVIGEDHAFGRDRVGNSKWLKQQLSNHPFSYDTYSKYIQDGKIVSSTIIRDLLKQGKIEEGNKLLGSPYSLKGIVVHGKKIGQKLNFPTANIKVLFKRQMIPKHGVYHILIVIKGEIHEGVGNIGINPTIDSTTKTSVEAHIFNFSKNIYGEQLTIHFLNFIRNEVKFSSLENLKKQIEEDINSVKKQNLCLKKIHINR